MSRTIEISDKAFGILSKRAKNAGVSLDVFIEEALAHENTRVSRTENGREKKESDKKKWKAWEDFIGAASRIPKSKKKIEPSRFGGILVEKFRKQGLKLDDFD